MTAGADKQFIKRVAHEVGFDLVGITAAAPPPHADYMRTWLAADKHAGLDYLQRHLDKRLDPQQFVPGARSIICLAVNYFTSEPPPPNAALLLIARYARRRDYHEIIRARLHRLADALRKEYGSDIIARPCVDSAPILEKAHAAQAGLGWIGKNGLLLNERYGSWLLLGELVTDLKIEPDQPVADQCGSCERCLQACPTKALTAPRELDVRRCLSYWTIEAKHPMPPNIARSAGNCFFGCDHCQNTCPFNQQTPTTNDPQLQSLPQCINIAVDEARRWTEQDFHKRFASTPLQRASWPLLQERLTTF